MRHDRDENEAVEAVEFEPSLVASVCALEGHGKTEFAALAPGRVEYFNVDVNTREILKKLQQRSEAEDLVLHDYDIPAVSFGEKAEIASEAEAIFSQFAEDLRPIVKGSQKRMPKTVVLDTATEFFELALLADHGKAVQILPEMRTKTNYKWKSLVNALKRSGCNVLLLHRLRDKYETQKTRGRDGAIEQRVKVEGEYEREGFSKTGFIVNVEVFLKFDPKRDKGDQYGMQITRCTQRPVLIGKEYWGVREVDGEEIRAASFLSLARLVYKNTTLDDWR